MSKEDAYMDGLLHAHLDAQEAAESHAEWIEERAEELLADPEMVYDIARYHLIPDTEDYEHLIPELLRDMVLLHNKHPSDLLNSDLLAHLYHTARALHDQAIEFATWRAEEELEKMREQYEKDKAEAMMSDWDD